MPAEDLRTEEIASLLGAASEPRTDAAVNLDSAADCQRPDARASTSAEAVGRGESLAELPFSADVRFTMQSVTEEFGDGLSRRLKKVLGCEVAVKCGEIIADAFAAWILGMEQPTCFLVASLTPLPGKLLLELPPAFVFPALEQLLGGQASGSGPLRRPLTELEQRLSLRLSDAILESFSAAWQSMVSFQPGVERIETNPRVVRCLPALEPLLITSLGISWDGVDTTIRVAMPLRMAVAACEGAPEEPAAVASGPEHMTQPIAASLELGLDESAIRDFQGGIPLRIGRESIASVELKHQGVAVGRGELIEFHGRRAIRISEVDTH